nr:MAG TPA: hypothetical protein [Caudoviricetes sp.]
MVVTPAPAGRKKLLIRDLLGSIYHGCDGYLLLPQRRGQAAHPPLEKDNEHFRLHPDRA